MKTRYNTIATAVLLSVWSVSATGKEPQSATDETSRQKIDAKRFSSQQVFYPAPQAPQPSTRTANSTPQVINRSTAQNNNSRPSTSYSRPQPAVPFAPQAPQPSTRTANSTPQVINRSTLQNNNSRPSTASLRPQPAVPSATQKSTSDYACPLPKYAPPTATFHDPTYPASTRRKVDDNGKFVENQHLGVDYAAPAGTPVYSLTKGKVVRSTSDINDPTSANIVIQKDGSTDEYVYGHIDSTLIQEKKVKEVNSGDLLGYVMPFPKDQNGIGGDHLHMGWNQQGIPAAAKEGWGWGRAPATSTKQEAQQRGWQDIDPVLKQACAPKTGPATVSAARSQPTASSTASSTSSSAPISKPWWKLW